MQLYKNFITIMSAVIFMLSTLSSGKGESVSFKDGNRLWKYKKVQVLGWDLYIERSINKDKDLNDVIIKVP